MKDASRISLRTSPLSRTTKVLYLSWLAEAVAKPMIIKSVAVAAAPRGPLTSPGISSQNNAHFPVLHEESNPYPGIIADSSMLTAPSGSCKGSVMNRQTEQCQHQEGLGRRRLVHCQIGQGDWNLIPSPLARYVTATDHSCIRRLGNRAY